MRHLTVVLALLAGGCTTTASDLSYAPAAAPFAEGTPGIATVTVVDAREEKDPTYIGAVRGGFGNPLKTVVTKRPVAEEVKVAFDAALSARHMLGAQGGDSLSVQVTKLSANQLVRRDASAAFRLELRDASGRPVYADQVDVNRVTGSLITFDAGLLASTDDLRALMDHTMTEAIDQALDKPEFIAAAHGGS